MLPRHLPSQPYPPIPPETQAQIDSVMAQLSEKEISMLSDIVHSEEKVNIVLEG